MHTDARAPGSGFFSARLHEIDEPALEIRRDQLDPQFLADAEKMHIDVSAVPGAAVQELIQKLYATPKDIVEKARAAIRP